jgi:ketosteroid isomerase-like protein
MSQENIEIVKRAITAINERDVPACLAVCASDFELINPIAAIEGSNKEDRESALSSTASVRRQRSSNWR